MLVAESYQGPIPPAREMAGHEAALPGAADRILKMAEREQVQEHAVQNRIVGAEIWMRTAGQWFALVSVLGMLGLMAYVAYLGDPKTAGLLAAALFGLVALFLGYERITARGATRSSNGSAPPAKAPAQNKGGQRPKARR